MLSPCGLLLGGSDSVQWVQRSCVKKEEEEEEKEEEEAPWASLYCALQSLVNCPCSIVPYNLIALLAAGLRSLKTGLLQTEWWKFPLKVTT